VPVTFRITEYGLGTLAEEEGNAPAE
jgi:hypothetical protein